MTSKILPLMLMLSVACGLDSNLPVDGEGVNLGALGSSCEGAAPACCAFGGSYAPFAATCSNAQWLCPGTSGRASGTLDQCAAGEQVACSGDIIVCKAAPAACPGEQRFCCPFAGSSTPFAAACEGSQWVCAGSSGLASGDPNECTASQNAHCSGDIIVCQ